MTDAVSQLEAVIAGIEARTPHGDDCVRSIATAKSYSARIWIHACDCDWQQRVRSEIARTVERMGCHLLNHVSEHVAYGEHWAAAFRATQEQETKK